VRVGSWFEGVESEIEIKSSVGRSLCGWVGEKCGVNGGWRCSWGLYLNHLINVSNSLCIYLRNVFSYVYEKICILLLYIVTYFYN